MRILLDECIDQRFARDFPGHEVKSVPQVTWSGKKNGELLRLAEKDFQVFITIDRNLPAQQNIASRKIAIVVLEAKSSRLSDLRALVGEITSVLEELKPGTVIYVPRREE